MSDSSQVTSAIVDLYGPSAHVEHRRNHAGADKLNFQVQFEGAEHWVRVGRDRDDDIALDRWASCATRLWVAYGAPRLLQSTTLAGHTALVFEVIDGVTMPASDVLPCLPKLLDVTRRLHHDPELPAGLGQPVSSAESFHQVWVERLDADLGLLAEHVTPELHAWMTAQVGVLTGLTQSEPFTSLNSGPIHGDLWHENIMMSRGDFRILDWEDLALGDPVVDDALLLYEAHGADLEAWAAARPPADPHEAARFQVALRAIMLDSVIDVLADAVETEDPKVATAKRFQHEAALAQFQSLYGSGWDMH